MIASLAAAAEERMLSNRPHKDKNIHLPLSAIVVFMLDVPKQTGAAMVYSVIVADDHALVRQGVKGAIDAGEEFSIAAEAADGIQAIIQVKKHRPNLLVLDIAMPHSNGIEVIDEVHRWSPETKILVLTGLTSGGVLRQARQAGANGVFLKSDDIDALLGAARAIMDGGEAFSPRVQAALDRPALGADLTPRERQVLQGLARGDSIAVIADRLSISANTADKHRTSIMRKLGVHSAGELMALAHREGLLEISRHT